MRFVKQIRETFGISQQDMAIFLGVSRSRVSMAESGRRELPTTALLQLGRLEKSLYVNTISDQRLQKQADKDIAALQAHAESCRFEVVVAKTKLLELQEEHQKNTKLLSAAIHLERTLPENAGSKKERLLMEILQAQALKRLKKCGLAAQVKLELKIQSLELEAKKLAGY